MSVDEALRRLNIDQKLDEVDDTILPAIFESARQDRPGELTEKAITTIQQAKANGSGATTNHPPETWPVGLRSHGNTCYLNSLLQYYFSIKPLRDIVLNYDQYLLDTSNITFKEERVGRLMRSLVEIKGGQRFAADLKYLFERMIKSSDSAVKPEQGLVERAFLRPKDYALLDPAKDEAAGGTEIARTNDVDSAIDDKVTDGDVVTSPTETLRNDGPRSDASSATLQASVNGDDPDVAMANVELPPTPPASPGLKGGEKESQSDRPPPALPPRRFSTTTQATLELAQKKAKEQQDVTEVHDSIMALLRCGMIATGRDEEGEQEDVLRDLFSMSITDTVVNKGVPQAPKLLYESSIQVNVPTEDTDIYSALDAIFDLQPYGENPEMEMYKSIRSLPPFLQISIPRINYDASRAGGAAYKALERVKLEDELYLDRYFDQSHAQTLPKRKQCWGWRKQLQGLRVEHKALAKTPLDLDGPTVVAQTADYLTRLDEVNQDLRSIDVEPIEADGDITSALTAEAQQQAERVAVLEKQIDTLQKQLDAQFADMKNIKYRLAAVFIHRGNHGSGHYWIDIHDFKSNMWRSYNDEHVEEFTTLSDLFEAKGYNPGTPTYAVYVADEKKDFVQPVCRVPEKPPTPPPTATPQNGDVEMANAKSQQDSFTAIDPKLTQEGGQASWDEHRQVADDVKW